ncbi:hypothetical protein B2K11_14935 [Microbacterium sp. B35-30]|nr:hypothetical protein B2K11_14935 [Microbacterium sp. B35-30]
MPKDAIASSTTGAGSVPTGPLPASAALRAGSRRSNSNSITPAARSTPTAIKSVGRGVVEVAAAGGIAGTAGAVG